MSFLKRLFSGDTIQNPPIQTQAQPQAATTPTPPSPVPVPEDPASQAGNEKSAIFSNTQRAAEMPEQPTKESALESPTLGPSKAALGL
jgi:hypothetical protein